MDIYISRYLLSSNSIPRETEYVQKQLKEVHPNLLVTHGGLGGYVKPKPRPEPLNRLSKLLEEHNINMIDVFRKFDPDNNMCYCF